MKTTLLTLLTCTFLHVSLSAQTIPNAGFENWTTTGSYEDPQSWGTLNSVTSILSVKTVEKATATDVHSGNAAIKLTTKKVTYPTTRLVPGLAVTGTINIVTQNVDGGFPCNQRPTSLKGWYKYAPAAGKKDTASVGIVLSKWNATSKKRETVGIGQFNESNTVATYTEFTAAITYTSAETPDTCLIVLLSSQQTGGVENSTLFIDDLVFDLPTGINATTSATEINVFPNPSNGTVFVSNYPAGAKLLLYDIKGSKCAEVSLSATANQLNADNGLYFYQIQNQTGDILKNGKLIIHN